MGVSIRLGTIDGVDLGAVQSFASYTKTARLSAVQTAGFSVEPDSLAAQHLGRDSILTTYAKVYHDDVHVLNGPLIGSHLVLDADGVGRISAAFAGVEWRLASILCGMQDLQSNIAEAAVTTGGAPGAGYVLDFAAAGTQTDRCELARRLIRSLTAWDHPYPAYGGSYWGSSGVQYAPTGTNPSDVGIIPGTIGTTDTTRLAPFQISGKSVLAVLNEIGDPLGGYEWKVRPVEPYMEMNGGTPWPNRLPVVGRFDCAETLGTARAIAWDYGGGAYNLVAVEDDADALSMVNFAHALPPGWPDSTNQAIAGWQTPRTANDAVSRGDYGLLEAIVSTDQATDGFRTKIAEQHVELRRRPRRTMKITPGSHRDTGGYVPRFDIDYGLGDSMPLRVWQRRPQLDAAGTVIGQQSVLTHDLSCRVYACTTTRDDETGRITDVITIQEEG